MRNDVGGSGINSGIAQNRFDEDDNESRKLIPRQDPMGDEDGGFDFEN